jgi:hypothetical protein
MKQLIIAGLALAMVALPAMDATAHPHKKYRRGGVVVYAPPTPYHYTASYFYRPYRVKPKKVKSYGLIAGPGGMSFHYSKGYTTPYRYYW